MMDANKMRDISREQFEATWADVMLGDEPPPGRKPARSRICPDRYAGDAAQFAWVWWQRSRDSVSVELPEHKDDSGFQSSAWDHHDHGFNEAIDECRAVIEAQGLKAKP